MERHNSRLRRFLLVNNLEYKPVIYEEFAKDPTGITDRLIEYIGLVPADESSVLLRVFEKQSAVKNEEFYARFASEVRRQYFGDGSYKGAPLFRPEIASAE